MLQLQESRLMMRVVEVIHFQVLVRGVDWGPSVTSYFEAGVFKLAR